MKTRSGNSAPNLDMIDQGAIKQASDRLVPYRVQTKGTAQVLIVDDESLVREMIARKLTEEGLICADAASGDEALQKLRSGNFDLVLLDIRMPHKSGLETLAEIKTAYPDIAVIIVTVVADIDVAIESMKRGAYDFIIKPIDFDVLALSVDRALEKRQLLLENRKYQRYLEQRVAEQTNKIRELFLSSVKSLVYALEAKDIYTSGHSQRVADIAVEIALAMSVDEAQLAKIKLAGILHDIGKVGVPESILNKPGRLEKHEYDIVKTHSKLSEMILRSFITDEEILQAIRHHHERYDGGGYPDGLSGDAIPWLARILALADAYDAMASDRPYRKAIPYSQILAELEKGCGTQFDPQVLSVFLTKVVSKFQVSNY